jgi:membrane-associated protease RseP (regulator of RpoE activity)
LSAALAVGATVFLQLGSAHAETRVALVIGNGAYVSPMLPKLPNPPRDAEAIGKTLQGLGFDVDVVTNATRQVMEDALARLARKSRSADLTLLFYAGHGLQDQGRNYFAPIDAMLSDETDLRHRFVRLDDILDDLAESKGARILVVDACRDNGAVEALRAAVPKSRSASVTRGLARIAEAEGQLVAFATQPDKVAADGEGIDSPFTTALVAHLGEPGIELRTLLTRVRMDVAKATNNEQIPEVSDSLLGEVYLHPTAEPGLAKPADEHRPQAWMGVSVQEVTADIADGLNLKTAGGALVAGVTNGGPAARAGIQVGDVIIEFDGRPVGSMKDLPSMVVGDDVGKSVKVKLLRKGREQVASVELGRLDDSAQDFFDKFFNNKGNSAVASADAASRPAAKSEASGVEPAASDKQPPAPVEIAHPLGLTLAGMSPTVRNRYGIKDSVNGVVITGVADGSAAAEKRVQPGDVIVEVHQDPVASTDDVIRYLDQMKKDGYVSALLLLANKEGDLRFVAVKMD